MVAVKRVAIEKLSLYFFLSISDEEKAEKAIHSVWRELSAKTLNWKTRSKSWQRLLISSADVVHEKMLSQHAIRRSGVFQKALLKPPVLDWASWYEFVRKANKNEISAVLWVKVLGFPEELVAKSLNVSEGTIRYRLNRGLLKLGDSLQGSEK